MLEGSAAAAVPPAASGLDGQRVADPDARPDGGESLRDFYRRVAEFAADLAVSGRAAAGRDIAVVAHGGTLRMLSARLTRHPGRADALGAARQRLHPALPGRPADRCGRPADACRCRLAPVMNR